MLSKIREWLGAGSINIFGLPMSGKDTVGKRLAEDLGARFLSSGDIIRAVEAEQGSDMTSSGALIPTNTFYDIVLPYFGHKDLAVAPLVLSSIGRWSGEETEVMAAAERGGHPIRAVVELGLRDEDVRERWAKARETGDRGERPDDLDPEVFETRIREYHEKTEPVLRTYKDLGLLIKIDGSMSRDEVYREVVGGLYNYVVQKTS